MNSKTVDKEEEELEYRQYKGGRGNRENEKILRIKRLGKKKQTKRRDADKNAEEGKRQTSHRKRYNHAAIQQSHYRAAGCSVLYRITAGVQRSF